MKTRLLAATSLGAAWLGLAGVASAQTNDEAEVDVLATIVAAEAGLSVTGRDSLDFGRVSIPNEAGADCTYTLGGDREREVTQNNNLYGLGPTPASCAFLDNGHRPARFTVECPADQRLILMLRGRGRNSQGDAVQFETFEDLIQVDGRPRYDWNQQCTGATLTIEIGGKLRVTSDAVPTEAGFYVGNMTLEATYP